jgi:hypothetical protein
MAFSVYDPLKETSLEVYNNLLNNWYRLHGLDAVYYKIDRVNTAGPNTKKVNKLYGELYDGEKNNVFFPPVDVRIRLTGYDYAQPLMRYGFEEDEMVDIAIGKDYFDKLQLAGTSTIGIVPEIGDVLILPFIKVEVRSVLKHSYWFFPNVVVEYHLSVAQVRTPLYLPVYTSCSIDAILYRNTWIDSILEKDDQTIQCSIDAKLWREYEY